MSALIAIPNASELLEVPESNFNKWEVFFSIVQMALDKFNMHAPLNIMQKFYVNAESGSTYIARITDNFESAVNHPELFNADQILLMPDAVNGASFTPITRYTRLNKDFSYEKGGILNEWLWGSQSMYFPCICSYPLVEDYDEVTHEPSDKCGVYYMSRKTRGSDYKIFLMQVFVQFVEYINSIKMNFELSDTPIQIFGGLEDQASKYTDIINTYYDNAVYSGYTLLI